MQIVPVNTILDSHGMQEPLLNVLRPNHDNYKVLLFQPQGEIHISAVAGVLHKDAKNAGEQFLEFLRTAQNSNADLCITPEYSMPWGILLSQLNSGVCPGPNKIWVLGCQSISYADLVELRTANAASLTFIFEEPATTGHFLDPLAYVFRTKSKTGEDKTVVLVQFKTMPMGDRANFEVDNLQRGTMIYEFGTGAQSIRMATIICSDAFAFDSHAEQLHDRALIIHIQLNPDPRNQNYRISRDHLLKFQNDATEILCLNWAAKVCEWDSDTQSPWNNIGGTAWYTKTSQYDFEDKTLCANHKLGLYYTWLESNRTHALFFNYEPGIYELLASKVYHFAVAGPVSPRRGPQLTRALGWDRTSKSWVDQPNISDGFPEQSSEAGQAKEQLIELASKNPIAAERAIALCAGKIGVQSNWYDVRQLYSCKIDVTEIVKRVTVCQDPDQGATEFRVAHLRRCGQIINHLSNTENIPPALSDFKEGFRLDWHRDAPHQNAISKPGTRATLVNFGDEATRDHVVTTSRRIADYLHKTSNGEEESRRARQRLAVWYRDEHGLRHLLESKEYTHFDRTGTGSAFDIAGEA